MDGRRSNKLPEGVGKKIVEALKRQSGTVDKVQSDENDSSFDDLINSNTSENDSVSYEENHSDWVNDYQGSTISVDVNNEYEDETFNTDYEDEDEDDSPVEEFRYHEIIDEDDLDSYEYYKNNDLEDSSEDRVSSRQKFEEEDDDLESNIYMPIRQNLPKRQNISKRQNSSARQNMPIRQNLPARQNKTPFSQKASQYDNQYLQTKYGRQFDEEKPVQQRSESSDKYGETSSNIEIIMGLVSQLPSGVTQQTGAQIIRQTMEAIGFSMNKVLKEAQFAQDELAQAIRDNINTVEEYRNNIKILEKDVQKYRRKAEDLEDLISLFILSEKERKAKSYKK